MKYQSLCILCVYIYIFFSFLFFFLFTSLGTTKNAGMGRRANRFSRVGDNSLPGNAFTPPLRYSLQEFKVGGEESDPTTAGRIHPTQEHPEGKKASEAS